MAIERSILPRIVLAICCLCASAWAKADVAFRATPLANGNPAAGVFDVNDSGVAVGLLQGSAGFSFPGQFFGDGSYSRVMVSGNSGTGVATGISNSGHIVGYQSDASSYGFLTLGNSTFDLGNAFPSAVNDGGLVVGSMPLGSGPVVHAFAYLESTPTDLGTLGGAWSIAHDVNNMGHIVGQAEDSLGNRRAFLYASGAMHDLGTLGGANSSAAAINSSGQVVGWAQTSDGQIHGFVWDNGAMSDLGSLGSGFTFAVDINDAGQIVGTSNGRSFLFQDNAMVALEGLIDYREVALPGHQAFLVSAINNRGQIVGNVQPEPTADYEVAILLSPVPELSTLVLAILGIALVVKATKCRHLSLLRTRFRNLEHSGV